MIKPRMLRPGATLGIISPASAVKKTLVDSGIDVLREMGFSTMTYLHALDRGPLNYAGTVADRVSDLHSAFADPSVDAIICTRGGWGCAELLPHLDAALIKANPKAFLGYSDITSLHIWLQREASLITFHAPMMASDFAKGAGAIDFLALDSALFQDEPWSIGAASGLRVLRPGTAEGVLTGGCMSIYAEAIGTPYAPRPQGGVLFLEDVGTHAYQWDRMLVHLRYAGLLEGVTGIVFGDMAQCCKPEEQPELEAALLHSLRDFEGPIGIGLCSGHVAERNVTLPFGVRVRLELNEDDPRLHFVESAVTG
jgi:muramoyltetrapeptide carboxypeptidase